MDEAIGLVDQVYRIGQETRDTSALTSALDYQGFFMDRKGDYEEASRMESNSEDGRVNISQITYELIKDHPASDFHSRGKMAVNGKGEIEMCFVTRN